MTAAGIRAPAIVLKEVGLESCDLLGKLFDGFGLILLGGLINSPWPIALQNHHRWFLSFALSYLATTGVELSFHRYSIFENTAV